MVEPGRPEIPAAQSRDHELEEQIQAERSAEYMKREPSDYPWVVRWEERRTVYNLVVDIPVNFWDRYGGMHFFESYINKAEEIRNSLLSSDAQNALSMDNEPWMGSPILSTEQKIILRNSGKSDGQIDLIKTGLKELRGPLADELERSAKEYALFTGKVVPLFLGIRSLASGRNIGQVYMETPPQYLLLPSDYIALGHLPAPFMEEKDLPNPSEDKQKALLKELGHEADVPLTLEIERAVRARYLKLSLQYPSEDKQKALLKESGYTENVPLGIGIDRAERAEYLQSLSYTPDRITKWMARAKSKVLSEIEERIDEAFGKQIPISGFDSTHEIYKNREKYGEAYWGKNSSSLKIEIDNAWWKQFGFKDAGEGKEYFGDPLSWIPFVARRGTESTDYSLTSLKPGRLGEIKQALEVIKQIREGITDPFLTSEQKMRLGTELEQKTVELRKLMTEKGETLYNSLALENRLELRGKLTKLGVIEAIPQRFGPKADLLNKDLHDFCKGDKLAAETGKMLHSLWGLGSKYGFYARDFDESLKGDLMDAFEDHVDVEGWPYSDELSKMMAFVWWQIYKKQASGPEASQGKFGPLMVDLLSHSVVKQKNKNGEEEFKTIDVNGAEKTGVAEKGAVIGNLDKTLLEIWEEGTPFGYLPWDKVEDSEDMSRRWMLRAFFAEGRDEISLVDILTESKWDPKRLTDPAFVEAFKLAVRVDMKPFLFNEIIWRDVVKELDEEFKIQVEGGKMKDRNGKEIEVRGLKRKIAEAKSEDEKREILQAFGPKYEKWQKARKDRVDDYIYAWWWEGAVSTPDFESWAHTPVGYGAQRIDLIIKGTLPEETRFMWEEVVRIFWDAGINLRLPTNRVGKEYSEIEKPAYERLKKWHEYYQSINKLRKDQPFLVGRPGWINIKIDPNP